MYSLGSRLCKDLDFANEELVDGDAAVVVESLEESHKIDGGGEGVRHAEGKHEGDVATSVLYQKVGKNRVRIWFGGGKEGEMTFQTRDAAEKQVLWPCGPRDVPRA